MVCPWTYHNYINPNNRCIIKAVLHVQVGGDFRGNGVLPSLYDVVVSWLKSVSGAHLVFWAVFCMLFYVDAIAVVAENR